MDLLSPGVFTRFVFITVRHEVAELLDLCESQEESLSKELRTFEKAMAESVKGLDEEQKANLYDFNSDEYYKYSEVFPTTIRSSLVVTAYSLFENSLFRLCDRLQEEKALKVRAKDLSGRGIRQAHEYMKKVLDIPFPDNSKEWEELLRIDDLRNAIVHARGYLGPDNKGLREYIEANSTLLQLKGNDEVVIKNGFVPHCLEVIRSLVDQIENSLSGLRK